MPVSVRSPADVGSWRLRPVPAGRPEAKRRADTEACGEEAANQRETPVVPTFVHARPEGPHGEPQQQQPDARTECPDDAGSTQHEVHVPQSRPTQLVRAWAQA